MLALHVAQADLPSGVLCGMGAELSSTFSFCLEDLLLTWEHHRAHLVFMWADLGQLLPCGSVCSAPQPPRYRGFPCMSSKVLCRHDDAQSCHKVLCFPAKMYSASDVPKPSSHPFPQQLRTFSPPAQSGKGRDLNGSLQLASVGCSCALIPDNLPSSLKTRENISLSLTFHYLSFLKSSLYSLFFPPFYSLKF